MKIKNLYSILLSSLILASCDSFLEVEDNGRNSIPAFFSDMDGVRAALPGSYSLAYKFYDSEFTHYANLAGDMVELNVAGDTEMASEFNYSSTSEQEAATVGHIWAYGYEVIANVNNIIEYYPQLKSEYAQYTEELDNIIANALFLRALTHFNLLQVYAQDYHYTTDASHPGIPIVLQTPGPEGNPPRSTVAEVCNQIITDLKESLSLLENTAFTGNQTPYYTSSAAIKGLMAKVYLYMGRYEEAITQATEVINAKSLSEGEDYPDVFNTNGTNDETLFKLNGYLRISDISTFYAKLSATAFASSKLMALYDPEDIRLQLYTDMENASEYHYTEKFTKPELQLGLAHYDLIVLRTSEIYLIRAEAYTQADSPQLERAKDDLKAIRARALRQSPEAIIIPGNNQDDLMDEILDERARELSFEGHRLFDLKRMHKNLERAEDTRSNVKSITYPSPLFVLPIPLSETNANPNITQNPGY